MWFSKPLKSTLCYNGQLRERGTAGGTARGTERKRERETETCCVGTSPDISAPSDNRAVFFPPVNQSAVPWRLKDAGSSENRCVSVNTEDLFLWAPSALRPDSVHCVNQCYITTQEIKWHNWFPAFQACEDEFRLADLLFQVSGFRRDRQCSRGSKNIIIHGDITDGFHSYLIITY